MSGKSCEITTILKSNLVSKVERIKNKFHNANVKLQVHNHIHKRAIDWNKHGKKDITLILYTIIYIYSYQMENY